MKNTKKHPILKTIAIAAVGSVVVGTILKIVRPQDDSINCTDDGDDVVELEQVPVDDETENTESINE